MWAGNLIVPDSRPGAPISAWLSSHSELSTEPRPFYIEWSDGVTVYLQDPDVTLHHGDTRTWIERTVDQDAADALERWKDMRLDGWEAHRPTHPTRADRAWMVLGC